MQRYIEAESKRLGKVAHADVDRHVLSGGATISGREIFPGIRTIFYRDQFVREHNVRSMCALNNRVSKYVEQKPTELKGEVCHPQLEVASPAPLPHRLSEARRTSAEVWKASNGLSQVGPVDVYRTLHPATAEHTFFASVRGTFTTKKDHIRSHKKNKNLKNAKGSKMYKAFFSDQWRN